MQAKERAMLNRRKERDYILIQNVDKTFYGNDNEARQVLQAINLDIRAGEFIAIVGPSGCGKSTLLKILAGLIPLTGGSISFPSLKEEGRSPNVGMVFQAPVLLPWRTIYENLMVPAEILGHDKAAAREQALDLLEMVGLKGFEDSYPRQLSGGMQSRAAICRALLTEPDLLLMDEPFGALDALTREELTTELMRILAEKPKTVMFVTHSIQEAILLADRVLVMSARPGRIMDDFRVELPRPRSWESVSEPEFVALSQRVREGIFSNKMGNVVRMAKETRLGKAASYE